MKVIVPYGQMRAEGQYGGPADDWIKADTGIYARRVSFKMLSGRQQSQTCDQVKIIPDDGLVTILCTCAADDLQIFYTDDGSFPANDGSVNPKSQRYVAPFQVPIGTKIRAMAYAPGRNPSSLIQIDV